MARPRGVDGPGHWGMGALLGTLRACAEARGQAHQVFDWWTWWGGPEGPQPGPMGRAGTRMRAVERVVEALTLDIPPGVPAKAEIHRVDVLYGGGARQEGGGARQEGGRREWMVAERDAAGAIRWSGELGTAARRAS